MEEKTPMFMVGIVGVVALIGISIMLANTPGIDTSITGNVVSDATPINTEILERLLFIGIMLGAAIYLYYHNE